MNKIDYRPSKTELIAGGIAGAIAFKFIFKGVREWLRTYVIEVDLDNIELVDRLRPNNLQGFEKILYPDRVNVHDILFTLEKSKNNPKVKAVIIKIGKGCFRLGIATAQSIRKAIESLVASGKEVIGWCDSMGEGERNGLFLYWLASACSKIIVHPSAMIPLTGIQINQPFLRGTLRKCGIEPHLEQREEYKNFADVMMRETMSDAHRESIQSLLGDIQDLVIDDICKARKFTKEQFNTLIDNGPHLAQEALKEKLVDDLLYRDEIYSDLEKRFPKSTWIYDTVFASQQKRPHEKGCVEFALVNLEGMVHRGVGETSPYQQNSIGGDTACEILRMVGANKKIKVLILRIDSGGGSYVASDAICREIVSLRNKGIKTVAYMTNVAASGGYFIAMACDKIIAQESTITGSIGVVFGKFNFRGLAQKIDMNFEGVPIGEHPNSTFFSGVHGYNEIEKHKLEEIIDNIYEDFRSKVAKYRNLSREEINEVSKGRVWTGKQALKHKLIDGIGGINEAIEAGVALLGDAKIKSSHVKLVEYPKKRSLFSLASKPQSSKESEKEGRISMDLFSFVGSVLNIFNPLVRVVQASTAIMTQQNSHVRLVSSEVRSLNPWNSIIEETRLLN